jgi:hypothetical protein
MTTATDTMTHHLPCTSKTKLADPHDKREEPLPSSKVAAPLHIPFERRLQMGSIAVWLSCSLSCTALFLAFWTHSFWFPLALVYLAYIYLDRATPNQGGRRIQTVREWSLWKYLADYFPIQVIKVSRITICSGKRMIWLTNGRMDPLFFFYMQLNQRNKIWIPLATICLAIIHMGFSVLALSHSLQPREVVSHVSFLGWFLA